MSPALWLAVAIAVFLGTGTAAAQPAMIPPGQETFVLSMLGGPDTLAGCKLDGASIDRDHIDARYTCDPGARAFTITLRHPDGAPASAPRTNSFVLEPGGGPAPEGLVDAVARRVRERERDFRWLRPTAAPPPTVQNARSGGNAARAWLLAASLLVLPAILGIGFARLLRRRLWGDRRRRAALVVASVSSFGLACLVSTRWPAPSFYDLLSSALLFSIAALASGLPRKQKRLRLVPVAISVSLVVLPLVGLEIFLRSRGPSPFPVLPSPRDARFLFEANEREPACRALFPDARTAGWFPRFGRQTDVARVSGMRRVVHLGDSMVEGSDVSGESTFVAALGRLSPGVEHLNLGISGTGTDAHFLVARSWLSRLSPDEIVLHVFPGNDVDEMDRPYACAEAGPLLGEGEGPLGPRFQAPVWSFPLVSLLHQGPAPFPMRVAGHSMETFRRLVYGFEVAIRKKQAPELPDAAWRRFEASLKGISQAAQAAGARLTVSALPVRQVLERAPSHTDAHNNERVLEILRGLGIPALDAREPFVEKMARDPSARFFQTAPNNPHFNEAGHELYASWLAERLSR